MTKRSLAEPERRRRQEREQRLLLAQKPSFYLPHELGWLKLSEDPYKVMYERPDGTKVALPKDKNGRVFPVPILKRPWVKL